MSGTTFKVPPRSRAEIREVAQMLHRSIRFSAPPFPIVEFTELVLPRVLEGFSFGVLPIDEMGESVHGSTFPSERLIYLREDVYLGAVAGRGRDRMTLAHEIGHLFLHNTGMHREMPSAQIRRYEDSEWQANCFGGELLVPDWFVQRAGNPGEIADKCQVSMDAALFAWRTLRK